MSGLIDLDGPLHDWPTLSEDELRRYATQFVGFATNEMSDPKDLSWTLERVDLERFLSLQTDWRAYFEDEVPSRYNNDFISGEFHSPIVFSIEMGEIILWDGYHRIATAMHRHDQTIFAMVGREL